MKKILLSLIFVVAFAGFLNAAEVTITWNPASNEYNASLPVYLCVYTSPGGYDIYGPQAMAAPGETQVVIKDMVPNNTYYMVAFRYDPDLCEYGPVNEEISYTVPLGCQTPEVISLPALQAPEGVSGVTAS